MQTLYLQVISIELKFPCVFQSPNVYWVVSDVFLTAVSQGLAEDPDGIFFHAASFSFLSSLFLPVSWGLPRAFPWAGSGSQCWPLLPSVTSKAPLQYHLFLYYRNQKDSETTTYKLLQCIWNVANEGMLLSYIYVGNLQPFFGKPVNKQGESEPQGKDPFKTMTLQDKYLLLIDKFYSLFSHGLIKSLFQEEF